MDFGELLHTAKKNEQSKPQIQYYSTKFAPPKKEQRTKNLSVNVQKFLARKEAEEKVKQKEALEKKNKLLALRSQDKKATRRVNVMLKRTKSASQAVIEDAHDSDNTAVTLVGPSQPDEDDYGYVSQESSALYNKMMEKYSKMPEEPKFNMERKKVSTNLSSTKDRVKAALEKEKEEALLPHRRKRKHTDNGGDNESATEKGSESNVPEKFLEPAVEKKDVSKPKFKAAPPVNFSDLLKLAEKKQFEPVVIEPKKEDEERPLTKKQKKEMEREREWRERRESQNKTPQDKSNSRIPKTNPIPSNMQKIPRKNENSDVKKNQDSGEYKSMKTADRNLNSIKYDKSLNRPGKSEGNILKKQLLARSEDKTAESDRKFDHRQIDQRNSINQLSQKLKADDKRNDSMYPAKSTTLQNERPKLAAMDNQQKKISMVNENPKLSLQNNMKNKQNFHSDLKSKQLPPNNMKPKQFPPNDVKLKQAPSNGLQTKQVSTSVPKSKQFPSKEIKPKQFLPPDVRRNFPPPDVRRNFPPNDVKRKAAFNKRRIIDDDEDYDSEMDDFIDDGPEESEDYSKYINEIFGYDKRRYRFDDDDVDNMETSFAQQMKEEVISTKIGIMEDLEDMRQEEEAKKRKIQMKKGRKL